MQKKHLAIVLGISLWLSFDALAQHPISLYYLDNVPQSSLINPAMAPRANGFLGIPAASMIYTNYYFDLMGPDIIQKRSDGKFITLNNPDFNYQPLYDKMGESANLRIEQTIQDIYFGFSGKKGYFTFGISEKFTQAATLPKDFFSVLDKGFPPGSQLDFSSIGINTRYYREFMFGYSYNFMDKLRIGINAKYLQGVAAASTKIEKMKLNTNVYEWGMDLEGEVNISGPIEVYSNENGVPDSIVIPDDYRKLAVETGLLNFSNPGLAFDIGAVYNMNHYWTFSGSVTDVGFISWHSDVNNFTANGSYTFEGLSVDGSDLDSLSNAVDELLDTIKTVVNMKHTQNSFTTALGPKVYLGAEYHLNHVASLGLLSRTTFFKNDFRQEFTGSVNVNLYRILTTTLNYTYAINGISTVGFGLALRGGPLQFYLAGDYFPYEYRSYKMETTDENGNTVVEDITPIGPVRAENFNVVVGLNLLFGAKGFKDSPMIDAYKEF